MLYFRGRILLGMVYCGVSKTLIDSEYCIQREGSQGDRRLTIHRRRYHITIGNKKTATAGRYDFFQRLLILLVISAKRYHYGVWISTMIELIINTRKILFFL